MLSAASREHGPQAQRFFGAASAANKESAMISEKTVTCYKAYRAFSMATLIAAVLSIMCAFFWKQVLPTGILFTFAAMLLRGWFAPTTETKKVFSAWRKLGLRAKDMPTSQIERDAFAGWIEEKLWSLAIEATDAFNKRDAAKKALLASRKLALKEIGRAQDSDIAAVRAHRRFLMAWDLFTKTEGEGGLGILTGPRFIDPEQFRQTARIVR